MLVTHVDCYIPEVVGWKLNCSTTLQTNKQNIDICSYNKYLLNESFWTINKPRSGIPAKYVPVRYIK